MLEGDSAENKFILCQSSSFIAENVVDLGKLLCKVGCGGFELDYVTYNVVFIGHLGIILHNTSEDQLRYLKHGEKVERNE